MHLVLTDNFCMKDPHFSILLGIVDTLLSQKQAQETDLLTLIKHKKHIPLIDEYTPSEDIKIVLIFKLYFLKQLLTDLTTF